MRTDIYDDILSVFQLNEYVRRSLAADPFLSMLRVSGEISNFKRHTSGHMYFTLKDDQAQVRCVMFRQDAFALEFAPKDGDHVLLRASASLYAQAGQYQLYVRGMTPMGMGALHLRFEALKRALGEEGLFDAAHKKPLPFFPASVGIATSQTGAALQDMLRILRERNPAVDILVAPCQVQGKGAERTIISAMRRLADAKADVIIIGRGGGSLEDLWAFNEESLARAVYDCAVPVISAVGHETDYTMTDFCADARAALGKSGYRVLFPDDKSLDDTSAILAQKAKETRGELFALCPPHPLENFFGVGARFRTFRTLFNQACKPGTNPNAGDLDALFPVFAVEEAFADGHRDMLLRKNAPQLATPMERSLYLDSAASSLMRVIADSVPQQLVKEYMIDRALLTAWSGIFRLRWSGVPAEMIKSWFVFDNAGELAASILAAENEPKAAISSRLSVRSAARLESLDMQRIRADIDEAAAEVLRETVMACRMVPYGAERALSYLVANEIEMVNLELCLGAIANNIDRDVTLSRLRREYA